MQLTYFEVLVLVALSQIPTILIWFQTRLLKQDQIDAQRNQKPVVVLLHELLLSEKQSNQDLMNRLMSKDLPTYERMTVVAPVQQPLDSTSSTSEEPRLSMSDYAEWARENGQEEVSERDLQDLSDDFMGLGNLQ